MDFLTWGRSPWGQAILTHISWNLLWASLFAGVAFLVAHASYMVLSAHRKRKAEETDAMEAARTDLPPPGMGGIGFSSFGSSATMASVVSNSPAMDAAFCSAVRVTLVGSTMPSCTMSPYSPVAAL